MKSIAIFSKDALQQHRYSLFRSWGEEKNYATLIMHNPTCKANEIAFDKSIFLAHNYFYTQNYDGYYIVNLYSYRSDNLDGLKGIKFKNKFDSNTNKYIELAVQNSKDVYLAWGTNNSKKTRIDFILRLLTNNNIKHVYKLKKIKKKNIHPSYYNTNLEFDRIETQKKYIYD